MKRIIAPLAGFVLLTVAHAQGFPQVNPPDGNPITADKVQLGKALFWEEQLSSTRTVACASCHLPSAGGGADPRSALPTSTHPGPDGRLGTPDDSHGSPGVFPTRLGGSYRSVAPFGVDVQITRRRAPSVINKAFSPLLFWDGRAVDRFVDPEQPTTTVLQSRAALESQAAGPPVSEVEMSHFGESWTAVAARIAAAKPLALASGIPTALAQFIGTNGYPELFRRVFGTTDVTPSRILMAIATYERTLVSDQAPFDLFRRGNQAALTQQQLRGLGVFMSPNAACITCHREPFFTDNQFHNTGVRPVNEDPGRFDITNQPRDRGAFRTPDLRNVELRPPYFHNGGARTLAEVVEFYDRGGDSADNRDPRIHRLNLSPQQKADLVAFLQSLTDPRVRAGTAPFDEMQLFARSPNAPQLYGMPTPGSGNFAPRMLALTPPLLGNPEFSLGVAAGLGGAPGLLAIDGAGGPPVPVGGAQLFLGLTPAMVVMPPRALEGAGAGNGFATWVFALPGDPTLRGLDLFAQWVVADPGPGRDMAASAATRFRLF
ncbi:MAG: c-type cytochrome [Planctomycetes bacterium]|nr:c-type cytochrome [Planctomycetota bacterium]